MRKLFLFIAMLWIILTTTICFVIAVVFIPVRFGFLIGSILIEQFTREFQITRIKYKTLNQVQ